MQSEHGAYCSETREHLPHEQKIGGGIDHDACLLAFIIVVHVLVAAVIHNISDVPPGLFLILRHSGQHLRTSSIPTAFRLSSSKYALLRPLDRLFFGLPDGAADPHNPEDTAPIDRLRQAGSASQCGPNEAVVLACNADYRC